MGSGRNTGKRKLSAGTVFMLVLIAAVLAGSALVIGRLSSGASVDLSKLNMSVLDIREDPAREENGGTDGPPERTEQPEKTAPPTPAVTETPVPQNSGESFTLTVGGSISLSGEVRKNSRNADAKVADYADVMLLLAPEIHSDENIVFLENILSDRHKTTDFTAPGQGAILLKEAGFSLAACGFSRAYDNGREGIEATLATLKSQGTGVLGIRGADDPGDPEIRNENGIRTAYLQYTDTVPAKTRKGMEKDGTSGMVPEAEITLITQGIRSARDLGAEIVVVLLNWGKNGKEPDKAQRALAEETARAGADLIIGNGSHVPQAAEYLTGLNGRSVLCVWSLGSLLSGDRSNIRHMSGYLLHVTVRRNAQGGTDILNPEYTPVYTWKYKQDGRTYYRCVAADGEAPDGMDKEQRNNREKAAEAVSTVLKDTPLTERGQENAD